MQDETVKFLNYRPFHCSLVHSMVCRHMPAHWNGCWWGVQMLYRIAASRIVRMELVNTKSVLLYRSYCHVMLARKSDPGNQNSLWSQIRR